MKSLILIISLTISFLTLGQSDSAKILQPDPFNQKVLAGVYNRIDTLLNQCFYEKDFKDIWRKIQYRNWKAILEEKIDLDKAYNCPEIALELYGKELRYYRFKYDYTEDEKKIEEKRIEFLKEGLVQFEYDPNPLVQCKANFLLGHQLIWFTPNGRKKKINFLKKYISIIDSFPEIMEKGENFGPNLDDYRNTLRTLMIATAKFDDKHLSSFYLEKLKQTFANDDYSNELIIDAAYYYGLKENPDSSFYYLKQVEISKSEHRFDIYSGYFDVYLLNLLNNHFNPYLIKDSISEFEANIPDSLNKEEVENEIKLYKRNNTTLISYPYFQYIDGLYRIVKFKYKDYEAIFEAASRPGSHLIFKDGLLRRITYWNHLKSRLNTYKRFSMDYDKQELIRKLNIYTGVYHIDVIYSKKNKAKYFIDGKKAKVKIAFPIIKQYFIEEGLLNFFTYHIPGGYEEMNEL